jgi:hypothetical protein
MTDNKTAQEILEILQAPTPYKSINFLPRGVLKAGNDGPTAIAIPYVSSDFVENRLDEACGAFGWQSQIIDTCNTVAVGVGIFNPDTQEWLWRWDIGSDNEKKSNQPQKEEVTSAIKRAARQWGIGRDLKNIPKLRVRCKVRNVGNDIKFVKWWEDPREAIQRFVQSGTGERGQDTEEASSGSLDEGKLEKEPTPKEARTTLFSFAVEDIEMSQSEAAAWIRDQESEHGKTVEAYRNMYKLLKSKTEPPNEEKIEQDLN